MYERIVLALCVSTVEVAHLSLADHLVVHRDGPLHSAAQGAHLHIFHWTLRVNLLPWLVEGIHVIIYFSDAFKKLVVVDGIGVLFVRRAVSVIWSLGSVGVLLLVMTQVARSLHPRLLLTAVRLWWSPKGTGRKRRALLTLLDAAEEGMSTAHDSLFLVLSIFKTNVTLVAACLHLNGCWNYFALWRWAERIWVFLLLILIHELHIVPLCKIFAINDLSSRILLLERPLRTLNYRVLHGLIISLNSLRPTKWGRALKFWILLLHSILRGGNPV